MNNFGVYELASARTTHAPGWAYVPDTAPVNPSTLASQGGNRKRTRNTTGGGVSVGDLSARQEQKLRKEAEALDRDAGRDNSIPLPVRSGKTAQGKHTPNVRKILQSQKTFANHLDDYMALQALAESNPNHPSNAKKASGKSTGTSTPHVDGDLDMSDSTAPILGRSPTEPQGADPGASDPLLMSTVPEMPSDEELRRLLSHPPLDHSQIRGRWEENYPVRVFCAVCGYWGRVRCMKCGTRVCALECLETHREECVTRYGV